MPKKTVYVRESDLPLWERAEVLAQGDSVSSILTEALQQYLEGRQALTATVCLKEGTQAIETRVQPVSSGWMLAIPDGPAGDALRRAVEGAGLGRAPRRGAGEEWVWVPAAAVASLWFNMPATVGGADYPALARRAWPILVRRAQAEETVTYGQLGTELSGLHPLRQVPQVLDVIEQWCLGHDTPDLTGVVVSQSSGLPGQDYWRQNSWAELSVADRVDRWREALRALARHPWASAPPF